jgi:hypothetical protein
MTRTRARERRLTVWDAAAQQARDAENDMLFGNRYPALLAERIADKCGSRGECPMGLPCPCRDWAHERAAEPRLATAPPDQEA